MRPNVVVIVADDLGYGDLGCFGNPRVRTPCLDALAGEGLRLTQHYAGSPMCAPSRAALLTGRDSHRAGAIDVPENRGLDRIALCHPTMADLLAGAGYATGLVGKWHNGAIDPRFHPNRRGFAEFAGFQGGLMDYWQWCIQHNGSYRRGDGRYLTDVFTAEAVDFIRGHRREPFLLWLAYNAPHTPLQAPEPELAEFAGADCPTRAVRTIYAMNRRLDSGIGHILETLDAEGLSADTIVLFVSDNGPMFVGTGEDCTRRDNGVFSGSKGDVLEGGIRVPGIVRWPAGLPAGGEVRALVHFVDWLPTLLSCCGVAIPDGLDGQDAAPLLRGEPRPQPTRFWQWNRYQPVPCCNAAVRQDDWKLYWPAIPEALRKLPEDNRLSEEVRMRPESVHDITRTPIERSIPPPGQPRLFHIGNDPGEHHDLAATCPDVAARLRIRLETWFEQVEAERRALPEEMRGYAASLGAE
ncbi:MAG: sulfatase-like hydrolase/transferase [Lentisphaeria bacterium]|nr:sulfatase-like hydrolase/transferase [Lentisphaeria bacterium]